MLGNLKTDNCGRTYRTGIFTQGYLNVITGTPVFLLILIITDFLYYRQSGASALSA